MRSINEILTDADNSNDIFELQKLWFEIGKNVKKYPLVQLRFAIEFITEKYEKVKPGNNDIIQIRIFLN